MPSITVKRTPDIDCGQYVNWSRVCYDVVLFLTSHPAIARNRLEFLKILSGSAD